MEIKRIEATAEQIEKANARKFCYSTYIIPNDTELEILQVYYTGHSIDGKRTENAALVMDLGTKTVDDKGNIVSTTVATVIYIRSWLKPRRDYQGNLITILGSLNQKIASMSGKTQGEIFTYLKKLEGHKVRAVVTDFKGVNRLGDVQDISVNGWDLVGDFPAE